MPAGKAESPVVDYGQRNLWLSQDGWRNHWLLAQIRTYHIMDSKSTAMRLGLSVGFVQNTASLHQEAPRWPPVRSETLSGLNIEPVACSQQQGRDFSCRAKSSERALSCALTLPHTQSTEARFKFSILISIYVQDVLEAVLHSWHSLPEQYRFLS